MVSNRVTLPALQPLRRGCQNPAAAVAGRLDPASDVGDGGRDLGVARRGNARRGDSMMPTLHDGDIVLVDLGRRSTPPPGIFALHDGMELVGKRLEHIPNSDPPRVRIISDNPLYKPYEGSGEEVNIIGRIRWFAREM